MKKLFYAIFSIAIFTAFSFNIKADEFDIQNCKNDCKTAGDQYNICMASCDARKNIEEKKEGCSGNSICIDRWDDSLSSKLQFYLQCYTGTANGEYNYCTHDSDACYSKCPRGDDGGCKADCAAKDKVKQCILNAYDKSGITECKAKYNEYLQKENQGSTSAKPDTDVEFNYNTCKSKCDSSDHECESDCYAQSKVEECKKDCRDGNCERGCEDSYTYYYEQRLNTYNPYSKVQCGELEVPYLIPQIVRTIIVMLQIAAPVIIVILGSIDLFKAVIAQKEDDIKKGQKTFFRRLLVGALVFLVFVIVELVIGLVAPQKDNYNMWNCVDCFVNGDCKTN